MNYQSNRRKIKYDKIAGDKSFPVWIFEEFNRLAKKAVYVFCRWDNLVEVPKPKSLIAWVKNNHTSGDLFHEHGRQWEAICFYPQEEHEFIKRTSDVIKGKKTGNKFHPTEKPVDVIMQIIMANKGDIILDPFCGTGSHLIASQNLHRNFIGIEISPEYCKIAEQRLRQKTLL